MESSNPGEKRHGTLVVEVAMDAVGRDKMMLVWTGYKGKEKNQEHLQRSLARAMS